MHFSDPTHVPKSPAATLTQTPKPSANSGGPAPGVFAYFRSARIADLLLAWAESYRRWIFAALVVLYVAGFNGQWRLEPDSALYLSIGRNIAEGNGYTYHGKSHRLAYPGLPVIFAGLSKVAGDRTLLAALVLMPLLGLATLAMVYRLLLLHGDRATAVLVTFGVGISRLFYSYSFELRTDLPFLLGVMAFLVGYEAIFSRRNGDEPADDAAPAARPRWFDWGFLLGGLILAVTTRPAMWALVFAVVASLLWLARRGRVSARWGQLAVAVAVVATVVVFYVRDPRHADRDDPNVPGSTTYIEEDRMFDLRLERIRAMAATAAGNLWETFDHAITKAAFGVSFAPGVDTVLAVVVMAFAVALARRRVLWALWVLTTLGIVLLIPRPLDRYFLPVLPLLVYGWWRGLRWINLHPRLTAPRANALFLGLFLVGAAPNFVRTLGFIKEQQTRPFLLHYKEGRYASADAAALMIRRNTPGGTDLKSPDTAWVLVGPKFARILTFLSGRYCLEPDSGAAIDPRLHPVYALEPSDPTPDMLVEERQGRPKRPTVKQWLEQRQFLLDPQPQDSVPNKDPDAKGPWRLHRVLPG
jgi:hypothetical protein